jgi:Family of unknown function (DUF5990)
VEAERVPTATKSTIAVEIQGFDLPGRSCDPNPNGETYENIHVGVVCRTDTIELVPGDAPSARWKLEVTVRTVGDGSFDFGGPYVRGARDDRHLGLHWGTLDADGSFTVFRGAKLRFADVPPSLVRDVLARGGRLVGRLGLTDKLGHPVCARVRPPDIVWSTTASDRRAARGAEPC